MVYSDAAKRATYKYRNTKTKAMSLNFKTEDYDRIKDHANNAGIPVATYIREAVTERMDNEDRIPPRGKTHPSK